jgi:arabinofuranosyltransferase
MPFPAFIILAALVSVGTFAAIARLSEPTYRIAAAITGGATVMFMNAILYVRHYGDDSYITLRYARNLADGVGPVWNPGQHVEGYTNFLWMAVLAGMYRIGIDLVAGSLLLSYAAMLAMVLLVWRIWRLWADEEGGVIAEPATLAVVLVAIGLNDAIVFWGFSGLETPLSAALLTATIYLYLIETRGSRFPWSAVAAAAAAMTRPELVLVGGVTGGFVAWDAIRTRDMAVVRRAAGWAALFAVLYGGYFIWRYSYYGYLFPNTYYAKVGTNIDFIQRGLDYIRKNGVAYLFLPFIVGGLVLLTQGGTRVRRDVAYILTTIGVLIAAIIVEGGDAFAHGRFVAPLVPILYLTGICGLALMLSRAIPDRKQFAWVAAVAAIMSGLALAHASIDSTLTQDRRAQEERRVFGLWLNAHVPPNYTVAVFASGAVPYYSRLRSLDMLGLTDETIAHTDVPYFGQGIPAHEKYNIDYALETVRPEIFVLGDSAPAIITREELQRGGDTIAALSKLFEDPRTWEMYEPASVYFDGRWFNILERKDTIGTIPVSWTESGGFTGKAVPAPAAGGATPTRVAPTPAPSG